MVAEAAQARKLMTAEEFCDLSGDDYKLAELVCGEVAPVVGATYKHSKIVLAVGARLFAYATETGVGECTTADGSYVLSRNPDTVRVPDVAFVRAERLVGIPEPQGFFEGAPDLAVEVASPSDRTLDTARKVREYLEAGTRLVWVIIPDERMAYIHHPDGLVRVVQDDGVLDGEDVLPGFRLPLADVLG